MNREDIIRMAREQGLPETATEGLFIVNSDDLGRMLAAEREACAKVCDETLAQHYMKQTIPERDEALFLAACADCAAAIRARGETK